MPPALLRIPSYNQPVLVSDFDFELPPELIAQQPPAERGSSRMLSLNRHTGAWQDLWIGEPSPARREKWWTARRLFLPPRKD